MLLDGEHVGEGLAGVEHVAEGVDDGDSGVAGEVLDGLLGEGAGDDDVGPAIEIAGDVGDGLAAADGADVEDGVAAELLGSDFEGDAGAEGGFFEEQAGDAAFEGGAVGGGGAFDVGGEFHERAQLVDGEIEIAGEVASGEKRRGHERAPGHRGRRRGSEYLFVLVNNYTSERGWSRGGGMGVGGW